jgi:mannose-6-phosphate isomerase class I
MELSKKTKERLYEIAITLIFDNVLLKMKGEKVDYFLEHGMTPEEIEAYEQKFEIIDLTPGVVFHVRPGFVHRVVATTDLEFMEASTTELDDVIRLQDDQGRTHGKIVSEHTS